MKKSKVTLIMAISLIVYSAGFGQSASAPPKPGPEHAKLGVLVGNWVTEGESMKTSFGSPEKFSGKIVSEWMPGHFAIVRHVDGKWSVGGEVHSLEVITYDAGAKAYNWYSFDSKGTTLVGKTFIEGDTLTAIWEFAVNGKFYRVRGTLKGLGSDKLIWAQEYSDDGKTWKAHYRSTDAKSKP